MKPNGPDSESAEGRLGLEGQVPGSVPAEGGDGEGSQYEPSIYEGDDDGERMEEVEYPDVNDIWGRPMVRGSPLLFELFMVMMVNLWWFRPTWSGGSPGAFQPHKQHKLLMLGRHHGLEILMVEPWDLCRLQVQHCG